MDLRSLHYFVVIAECGSILAASEKLHIAQPSLSIRVKALEQELGVSLFDRRPRGVTLTSEGAELVAHARQILKAAETAKESLRQHAKSAVGTVSFGVPTSLASVICVPLVEMMQKELPNVRLRIVESMSGFILDWLRDGRLDVGLVFGDKSISGVSLEPVVEEDLFLAADSRESFSGFVNAKGEVTLENASKAPLVLPAAHHGLRQLIDDVFRRNGLQHTTRIEIDSFSQIQNMVHRKMGMTILSRAALYESPLQPPLVSARIVSPNITRMVSVAMNDQHLQTKATRETVSRIVKIIRERASSDVWPARLL